MHSTVSPEGIRFRQWAGKHGIANCPNPDASERWSTLEWSELLEIRNGLNRALTATAEADEIAPETADIVDIAAAMISNIGREMDARDKAGSREPRSKDGRITKPQQPGGGFGSDDGRLRIGATLGRDVAWAKAFPESRVAAGGMSFGELLRAVAHNDVGRIQNATGVTYTGADGGFAVPTQFIADIMSVAIESEIIRPRARFFALDSGEAVVPGVDGFDHSTNIGGFAGQWLAETGAATPQKPSLYQLTLKPGKLAVFADASTELVDDFRNFESFLAERVAGAISWFLDSAFLTGNGAGQPLGILNDPALIVVPKEGTQAAGSIVAQNVLKMYSRLHPSCFRNAVWVMNPSLIPQILPLHVLPTSIAGDALLPVGSPLMRQQDTGWSMMGLPVYFSEKVPALGSQGDIVLCDPSAYYVGMRADLRVARTEAARWTEDVTSWKFTMRVDGRGSWKSAVTPKNGSTQSWAVTLQAR